MSQKPVPLLAVVLRNLRVRAGWTQVRLEQEAGLSRGAVCRLEKGDQAVDGFLLGRLAKLMGIAEGDLERAIAALEQLPIEPSIEGAADLPSRDRQTIETVSSRFSRNAREKARKRIETKVRARRWRLDRAAAAAAWQLLRKMPAEDRKRMVQEVAAFHTWAVVERLCEESVRALASDMETARGLAQLARLAAAASKGPNEWRSWLQAYAAAFEANVCCSGGEFQLARKLFLESDTLLESAALPPGAPIDSSRPLVLRAVLLKYLGRFDDALSRLDEARRVARTPLQKAWISISRADVLKRQHQYSAALTTLGEAREHAEAAGDSRLRWAIAFNEATYLHEAGDSVAAGSRLESLRSAAFELGRTLDRVRLRWLTASIAAAAGQLSDASSALQGVWEDFAERRLWVDAALAALELANVELERGNTREVKGLAIATIPVFDAQILPAELLAAIQLFWQAARKEVASAETAKRLAQDLRRLRGAGAEPS